MVFAVTAATPAPSAPVLQPTPGDGRMNTLLRSLCVFTLSAATAATATTPPPALPDKVHVPLGCVVSSLAYNAKLSEARPDLRARLLRMNRRGEDHVMSLVTDAAGSLYARDEYLGVLDLNANTSDGLDDDQLAKRALAAHAAVERKQSYTPVRAAETRMQLREAAAKVAAMMPGSKLHKTRDGAFVTWPAITDGLYVYSGDRGTMTIEPRAGIAPDALAAALARGLGQGALVN